MKKYKKIILLVLFLLLAIYGYEKRSFHTNSNHVSVTIWHGLFGQGVFYLYPYKCYSIFRPGKEYIKVDIRNEFLELRFIDDRRLAICTYKKEYIDVKLSDYKIEKIYSGHDEYIEFNDLYPCEKCKACFSWAKISEMTYINK